MIKRINIYCGYHRNTIVKQQPTIEKKFALQIKCLECNGTGIFDCGIKEECGICISCKGTGNQYIGTI
nr:MAG TPA: TRYPTOPHAN RNA-BINDING ATTENUATOR PROTEIN-INHIBITORY PROTEIN REGULATION, ANTI-TRAP [Caudoviricetes sp.]